MLTRRMVLLLGAVSLLAACGPTAAGDGSEGPGTVPIGELPPPLSSAVDPTLTTVARTTIPLLPEEQIGSLVQGNRVILIGDSVLASTSRRFSNSMCRALVPLGWEVELNAETGRFVEFGKEVLDRRLSAGWDASVILLGNNYNGDPAKYRDQLERLVQRLSPQPVVLLTVSEFTPSRAQVNEVIFDLAERYDNVLIVDWGATSAADPSITGGDGLHLTDSGREVLAHEVSLALGPVPGSTGRCLTSDFTDDSAGGVEATTTTRPATQQTTKPTTKPTTPTTPPTQESTTTTTEAESDG